MRNVHQRTPTYFFAIQTFMYNNSFINTFLKWMPANLGQPRTFTPFCVYRYTNIKFQGAISVLRFKASERAAAWSLYKVII